MPWFLPPKAEKEETGRAKPPKYTYLPRSPWRPSGRQGAEGGGGGRLQPPGMERLKKKVTTKKRLRPTWRRPLKGRFQRMLTRESYQNGPIGRG